jgi:lipoprotein-releasing system ATP-binding protein
MNKRDEGQETRDKRRETSTNNSSLIKVLDIHKSFATKPEPLHVLKGIVLEIFSGEILAIVGPSGVGKSTFLHILGALDRPSSGKVFYNGIDIFQQSDEDLARFRNQKVGFIFQFHHLLPEFTALENTMMPALIQGMSHDEASNRAEGLLREVGLGGRVNHRPGELSGGEQQRVAVARALMVGPSVVLADEPTGNLDTQTGEAVYELLKSLQKEKGITFVIVTHNEKLAYDCNRVARMVDGRIDKIDIVES